MLRILLEQIEKQPVAILIRLLENAVEIADRLMVVQGEDEANHWERSGVGGRQCWSSGCQPACGQPKG